MVPFHRTATRLQRGLAFRATRLVNAAVDWQQRRQLIRQLQVIRELPAGDGPTVVTLIRNSMPWLPAFLDHYRGLGVNRFVFCDTGSADDSVPFLCDQSDTSVLSTSLPFGEWNAALRRHLAAHFAPSGWALVVDSDEFFWYPSAESVPFARFLQYLDDHRYTCVIAQMLDMLPAAPLQSLCGDEVSRRREAFPAYSLDGLNREVYHESNVGVSNRSIPTLKGGIRSLLFPGAYPMLTKHPLIRPDRGVRIVDQHRVSHARAADVSCILLHYKFTACLRERIEDAVVLGQYYHQSSEYRALQLSFEQRSIAPFLGLERPILWRSTEHLVEEGFLHTSPQYDAFRKPGRTV